MVHPASRWNRQRRIARSPADGGPADGGPADGGPAAGRIVETVGCRRRTIQVVKRLISVRRRVAEHDVAAAAAAVEVDAAKAAAQFVHAAVHAVGSASPASICRVQLPKF